MILKYTLALVFGLSVLSPALADKRGRDFPGAEDEEELKVQEELPTPPLKLDRRTLEKRALDEYLKTTEAASGQKPKKER